MRHTISLFSLTATSYLQHHRLEIGELKARTSLLLSEKINEKNQSAGENITVD